MAARAVGSLLALRRAAAHHGQLLLLSPLSSQPAMSSSDRAVTSSVVAWQETPTRDVERKGSGAMKEDATAAMANLMGSFVEDSPAVALEDAPTEGPMGLYISGTRSGLYRLDDRQARTMEILQHLYEDLTKTFSSQSRTSSGLTVVGAATQPVKRSWFSDLLSGGSDEPKAPQAKVPKGVYMFGGVGCGKTMMMDMLADSAPKHFKRLRTHFHDFMLDVHGRLRKVQKSQDPLLKVATDIASETRLLCLDEFFVTDVADAMILARLFGYLWDRGVVVVATSNRHPDKLYENGLQRHLFLPFIGRLKEACAVHDLASPIDYRKLAKNQEGTFFIGPSSDEDLHKRIGELAMGKASVKQTLEVQMGRKLTIPSVRGCVAEFSFQELCGEAVGAADYIALCNTFHTIAVRGMPIITGANKNTGYRLVTLIDVAYEHRCRMLFSAEGAPFDIFRNVFTMSDGKEALRDKEVPEEDIVIDDNLGFAKDRTVSRLIDMQSDEYREQHAQARAPHLLMALHEKAR